MGFYDTITPEKHSQEFGHAVNAMPVNEVEQISQPIVNAVMSIYYKKETLRNWRKWMSHINQSSNPDNYMNDKDIKSHFDFTMNSQGILFKTMKNHDKLFDALTLPKSLPKYILHESHSWAGHNGSTRLYQFIKRQYY